MSSWPPMPIKESTMAWNPGPTQQMPHYQSHKKVWALKIATYTPTEAGCTITFEDSTFAERSMPPTWDSRCNAIKGDAGYLVQYEDGFTSWSPTKAFEDGYTLLP